MQGRAHWSNGAKSPKFFFLPAATVLFVLLILFFPGLKTFLVGMSGIILTIYIYSIKKTTYGAFFRSVKMWITGVTVTTGSVLKIFRK